MKKAGLILDNNKPNPAYEAYFIKKKSDKGSYYLWSVPFIKETVTIRKPTNDHHRRHFVSLRKAEDAFCEAFTAVADIIGLVRDEKDVNYALREEYKDHVEAFRITEQCRYSDPCFMGGSCFALMQSRKTIGNLKGLTLEAVGKVQAAIDFYATKHPRRALKAKRELKIAMAAIEWIGKQRRNN